MYLYHTYIAVCFETFGRLLLLEQFAVTLASIMNKDKAQQFSLSLPESVHSLIPRYGSSRHLLGSIRRKMLAETGSFPSTAETTPYQLVVGV